MTISQHEKYLVSHAMLLFGGSFVSKLGDTICSADAKNTATIKEAFSDYWQKYLIIACEKWPEQAAEAGFVYAKGR